MKRVFGWFLSVFFCCALVLLPNSVRADGCSDTQIDVGNNTCIDAKFTVHTTNLNSGATFQFQMSAKGTIYIDCGSDGNLTGTGVSGKTVSRTNTTAAVYTCTYSSAGNKNIRFAGNINTYNTDSSTVATITFGYSTTSAAMIAGVSGSLGEVFPTIGAGTSASQQPKFYRTFRSCTNLTEIPATLFDGVSGAGPSMFSNTFYGCSGLKYIPIGLFDSITGTADYLFSNTFNGCTSLKQLPENLFSGITASSKYLFSSTFNGCSGLVGYIPKSVFSGLIDAGFPTGTNVLTDAFANTGLLTANTGCTNLGLKKVTITANSSTYSMNGKAFCEPNTSSAVRLINGDQVVDTVTVASGSSMPTTNVAGNSLVAPVRDDYIFSGYALSGTKYYNSGMTSAHSWDQSAGVYELEAQYIEPKFVVTTTNLASSNEFKIKISAIGEFYIDWGDTCSNVTRFQTINRSNTTATTYSCKYTTAGVKHISFSGVATEYNTNQNSPTAAITFAAGSPTYLASVSGSLGDIFPTLGNEERYIPKFIRVFQGCSNLTSVPSELFSYISPVTHLRVGATGAVRYMFERAFENCSALSDIPSGLFDGVSGAAGYMFYYTFSGCMTIPAIPTGLFNGVTTNNSNYQSMFGAAFKGCTNLAVVPSGLFDTVTIASPYMFSGIFRDCTSLTTLPDGLFENVTTTSAMSYLFSNAFNGCTGLTALPENLFSGVTMAGQYMFNGTFQGCSGLTGYIPKSTFIGLVNNQHPSASYMMTNIFDGATGLRTTCPDGTTQFITGYESSWNLRVSCYETTSYNIEYILDGGTNYVDAPNSYVFGTSTTINGTPTKPGYTFTGWCQTVAPDQDVCALSHTISTSDTGNKTFTAQWSANTITILWQDAEASDIQANNAGTTVYDGDIRTPAHAVPRPGYTFVGWKFLKPQNP